LPLDSKAPTAVFVVGSSRSGGVYALEWVRREVSGTFQGIIFMNVRTVDAQSYGGDENMERLRRRPTRRCLLRQLCTSLRKWPAKSFLAFGTDPIEELPRRRGRPCRLSGQHLLYQQAILKHDKLVHPAAASEGHSTMLRSSTCGTMPMVVCRCGSYRRKAALNASVQRRLTLLAAQPQ